MCILEVTGVVEAALRVIASGHFPNPEDVLMYDKSAFRGAFNIAFGSGGLFYALPYEIWIDVFYENPDSDDCFELMGLFVWRAPADKAAREEKLEMFTKKGI